MKRASVEPVLAAIAVEYEQGIKKIRAYREEAKARPIVAGANEDLRVLTEIALDKQEKRVSEMVRDVRAKIEDIKRDYAQAEKSFWRIDGAAITDDVKLLSLPLSNAQVSELQGRYINNPTMLSAVNEYAKKNNLPPLYLQSAESRIAIVEQFDKLIAPRAAEHFGAVDGRYSFKEAAEGYKAMAMSKVEGAV